MSQESKKTMIIGVEGPNLDGRGLSQIDDHADIITEDFLWNLQRMNLSDNLTVRRYGESELSFTTGNLWAFFKVEVTFTDNVHRNKCKIMHPWMFSPPNNNVRIGDLNCNVKEPVVHGRRTS